MEESSGAADDSILTGNEGGEAHEGSGLENAMAAVDLGLLSEEQVADLESGEVERIGRALDSARMAMDADDERVPVRMSLKAIPNSERKGLMEATQLLRDGKASSLREALNVVFGFEAGAVSNEAVSDMEATDVGEMGMPEYDERAEAEGNARIAELMERREQCRKSYDFETADALLTEINELKSELQHTVKAGREREAYLAEFSQTEEASRSRALGKYAELLNDPGCGYGEWVDVEVALAERRRDPVLNFPDWPEKIADRSYKRYLAEIEGGGKADSWSEGGMEPPDLGRRTGVRMPGSPVGGGANSMALTASAALSEFDQLGPEEQTEVLRRLDKSRL